MKQLRIESHLPAVSFELGDKYWIACGANWMEVDRIYSPEELSKIWVKTERKYDRPKVKTKAKDKIYRVAGSKGNVYRVKQSGDSWTCNCPASSFRRWEECKHIKQVKTKTK